MKQTDVVILGLNHHVLEIVDSFEDEKITIVDERSFNQYSRVLDFDDELLFGVYQGSLEASQFNVTDASEMVEFYQMIVAHHKENRQNNRRTLLAILKEKGFEVIKGRAQIQDDHSLKVDYLDESTEVSFNKIVLNMGQSEQTTETNPYIFTLEEYLETEALENKMMIEVKTLKDLEVAKLFGNFGVKVKALLVENAFREIDHLMFRDSIRDSLTSEGLEIIDRVTIQSFEEQATFGIVNYETHNDKFSESFTVFLRSVESVENRSGLGLELVNNIIELDDLYPKKSSIKRQVLHLTPAYVLIEKEEASASDDTTIRLNADEIAYFKRTSNEDGGLEVKVDSVSHTIKSATFYCHDSLILGDIAQLMMENDLSLDTFRQSQRPANSAMSVFVDIARNL